MIEPSETPFVERAVELAGEALADGDGPFGTIVVLDGEIVFEDRNRERTMGDPTRHPEFEAARWAATALTAEERARAVTYTSTEHCPMCGAAHGWVGLGRIVFASSGEQVGRWRRARGWPPSPVASVPLAELLPETPVVGPLPEFEERLRELHDQVPAP